MNQFWVYYFYYTFCCLLSQTVSPDYFFCPTNSYSQLSDLKFQSAALPLLCVMFQVMLSFVLDLMNIFVYFVFWSFLAVRFIGQMPVVSENKLNSTEKIEIVLL